MTSEEIDSEEIEGTNQEESYISSESISEGIANGLDADSELSVSISQNKSTDEFADEVLLKQYEQLRQEALYRIRLRGRRFTRVILSALAFLGVAFFSGPITPEGSELGISPRFVIASIPLFLSFLLFEEMRSAKGLVRIGRQCKQIEDKIDVNGFNWESKYGGFAEETFIGRFPSRISYLSLIAIYILFAVMGLRALGWSAPWTKINSSIVLLAGLFYSTLIGLVHISRKAAYSNNQLVRGSE